MKKTIVRFIATGIICVYGPVLFAQEEPETPDPALQKPIQIIMQAGIGNQSSEQGAQYASFSLERPIAIYRHVGVHYNAILPQYSLSFSGYGSQVQSGSYDLGVFCKFFLHGRLTGRKSTIFFGPGISRGILNIKASSYSNTTFVYYKETRTKFLLRWGTQHKFGIAVLEITLPIGVEAVKSPYQRDYGIDGPPGDAIYKYNRFVIMPCLQLGFAL